MEAIGSITAVPILVIQYVFKRLFKLDDDSYTTQILELLTASLEKYLTGCSHTSMY